MTITLAIQSDHVRLSGMLDGVGPGRHRGRRAADDRWMPDGNASTGHGRHRRAARTSQAESAEDADVE